MAVIAGRSLTLASSIWKFIFTPICLFRASAQRHLPPPAASPRGGRKPGPRRTSLFITKKAAEAALISRLGSGFLPPAWQRHWRGKMSSEGLTRGRQMGALIRLAAEKRGDLELIVVAVIGEKVLVLRRQ